MDLETDYLVVGAGALGMSFVDTLIEHSDADVVMVERRHRPGGHWLDSYPFVQLHQPSRYYGVDSTPLGQDRVEPDGDGRRLLRAGQRHGDLRLLRRGHAPSVPGVGTCPLLPDVRLPRRPALPLPRDRWVTEVTVRSHVVDATYMASRVPATDPPPFDVADGVRCVPVGELAALDDPPRAT